MIFPPLLKDVTPPQVGERPRCCSYKAALREHRATRPHCSLHRLRIHLEPLQTCPTPWCQPAIHQCSRNFGCSHPAPAMLTPELALLI